jgi:hypothetical protein
MQGASRVTTHGPASADAAASPRARAFAASIDFADGGSPATWLSAPRVTDHALIESIRLLLKLVLSAASSCSMALNRSFLTPSSPTPLSSAPRIISSHTRRCAAVRPLHTVASTLSFSQPR